MIKKCENCEHFNYRYRQPYDMGLCEKRKASVYLTGLPCRYYKYDMLNQWYLFKWLRKIFKVK